jgi:hypothetical protein
MSYQDGRSILSSLLVSAYISVSLPMVCTNQTRAYSIPLQPEGARPRRATPGWKLREDAFERHLKADT